MPQGVQFFFLLLNGSLLLLALVYYVRESRRRGDYLAWYLAIGASLAIVYEPIGDILIGAFWPHEGQIVWLDAAGRKIPLFIGLLYPWYMVVPVLLFIQRFESSSNASSYWQWYVATFILVLAYELLGVNLGAWVYYGYQPFVFWGVPIWIVFTFTGFVMALSVGVFLISRYLPARLYWVFIFAVPLLLSSSHAALTVPAALALFTESGVALNYFGGSASIVLTLLFVWLLQKFLVRETNLTV